MQLLDPPAAEVDVEALMHQLRSGVREGGAGPFGSASAGNSAKRDAAAMHLTEVERNAEVGTVIPSFERFGRLKRKAAWWTSRVVLYLAKIITVPQRRVNFGLLQAVRGTLACLKEEEVARLELQARVQLLERTVAALRTQLEDARKPAGEEGERGWRAAPHFHAGQHR